MFGKDLLYLSLDKVGRYLPTLSSVSIVGRCCLRTIHCRPLMFYNVNNVQSRTKRKLEAIFQHCKWLRSCDSNIGRYHFQVYPVIDTEDLNLKERCHLRYLSGLEIDTMFNEGLESNIVDHGYLQCCHWMILYKVTAVNYQR